MFCKEPLLRRRTETNMWQEYSQSVVVSVRRKEQERGYSTTGDKIFVTFVTVQK